MTYTKHIKIWWQAIRFHFTFPTFLPVLLGTLNAILETGKWNKWSLCAVLFATVCHHIGLNLADDYYDYCHGADLLKDGERNAYAGGSGVLTTGILTPSAVHMGAMICYAVTIIIGLILTYFHGWIILALGIFGVFSSFYYTAPPLRFAYRGLGEIAIWLNFGPVLVLGSYYVQAHTISLSAILLSILMGTLIFCLIMANEIPDKETDEASGKRTLVVRLGKKSGLLGVIIGIALIFGILVIAIKKDIWPMILTVAFLALPIGYFGIKTLAKTMNTNKIHGNEFIVGFCNILGILLVSAFSYVLFRIGNYVPAYIILGTLIMLYIPIVFAKSPG